MIWKLIPWTLVPKFIERIGIPTVVVGGLMYLIVVSMARLEKKIDALILQDSVNSVVLKGYRDSSEERLRLLRQRRDGRGG